MNRPLRLLGPALAFAGGVLVANGSSGSGSRPGREARSAAATTPASGDALVAWVPTVAGTSPPIADAMARVPRTAPAGPHRTANVYAARGETQGFAIVVKAEGAAITRLTVSSSALTCTSGECAGRSIPAENVDAYRAMYQIVGFPSGAGDGRFRGRTNANGPLGSNTLTDPGNGSMCGTGRPFGPAPCHIPDGLIPFQRCSDGSAPPCVMGDVKSTNTCAVDGTGCGPGAPSLAIASRANEELWIEIRVPRGPSSTPGGRYSGTIRLQATAGPAKRTATILVSLNVWDFEIPSRPTFKTGFGFNGGSQPSAFYNVEAQEMFARHKVSLTRYGSTTVMGVDDWPRDDYGPTVARLRRAWGVPNALQVGSYYGVSGSTCVTSWSPSDYLTTAAAEAWVASHRLPTSDVFLYARNSDEINSGLAEPGYFAFPYSSQRRRADGGPGCEKTCNGCTYAYLREAARQIHATTDPPIRMLSVVDPNPYLIRDTADLRGNGRPALDVFVAAPGYGWENPTSVASVTRNFTRSEMWTYNVWVADTFSPKWQLDYSPVSYRIGFIAQALGVSGAAIAEIADSGDLGCDAGAACPGGRSRAPDNPWLHGAFKNVCGGRTGPNCVTNGDSQWLYPASQVGLGRWSVVPHLRLKLFRDGIQDYELIEILKTVSGDDGYTRGSCTAAFPGKTCREIVAAVGGADWSTYSTDTSLLQRARKAIGDKIAADAHRPASNP